MIDKLGPMMAKINIERELRKQDRRKRHARLVATIKRIITRKRRMES